MEFATVSDMNFLQVALEIETDRVRKLDFYRSIPHCTLSLTPASPGARPLPPPG